MVLVSRCSLAKILAMAGEDPSLFYLGDREVTVEERRAPRAREPRPGEQQRRGGGQAEWRQADRAWLSKRVGEVAPRR